MKYVILSLIILLISIAFGILIVFLLNKIFKIKLKKRFNILIVFGTTMLLILLAFIIFALDYYHADKNAYNYLKSSDTVNVKKTDFGYFFDGESINDAIIFYPGAKVEVEAYAPLMYMLAEEGIDTFLVKMPLNLAAFGKNKAKEILNNFDYNNYYMAGHSLGGVEASKFAKDNDNIKGIIFLASYSTVKLDDNIIALSIYGDCDKVLNINEYNKNKGNFPTNYKEVIIEGANHANFGMYNNQKGDGTLKIGTLDQLEITKNEIIKFLKD